MNFLNTIGLEVMTKPITSIDQEALITDACHLMANQWIKKLPIINEKKDVIGIMTLTDVINNLKKMDAHNQLIIKDIMKID